MGSFFQRSWLFFAIITTVFWGIWEHSFKYPKKQVFRPRWVILFGALTMIPCALVALYLIGWKLEYDVRSILLGSTVGLLGAGGQLLLFQALRSGPAYIVFPIISLFPIVTIALSTGILKEKASIRQWIGIVLALIAVFFLSYQEPENGESGSKGWLLFTALVFLMWGVQAFVMKFSNETMRAESIFFYMMITGVILIPVALSMTDFTQEINWGFKGPYLASGIHVLNSIGALTLVYAVRYGKSIVVVPMTGLSPLITVAISLVIYAVIPDMFLSIGVLVALVAIFLLSE